jgi:copper chaperone NosL
MKTMLFLSIPAILMMACSSGPEPIRFGHDSCEHCKMVIMDPKFGAELVTKKGKVFKLDDVNCLFSFQEENRIADQDAAHLLVVDFGQPETLIDVNSAFFIFSGQIRSPMASGLAAFSDATLMEKYYAEWGGEKLSWSGVKKLFE